MAKRNACGADYADRKERGNCCFKLRQYDAACVEYSAALACATSDAHRAVALNNRALARLEMGEHAGAVEDCTTALALDPANVKALMRRALAYVQQQEHDRAVADYTTAIQYTPKHLTPVEQPAWVPLCRIRRALALESLNRLDGLETALADLKIARGCVLPADTLRLATDGIKRISRSIEMDSTLRKEHPADEGLVRSDQLLRLYFSSALPTQLCLGEPFSVSVHVANELGCWRREDFARLFDSNETAARTGPEVGAVCLPLALTVHAWPREEAVAPGEGNLCQVKLELLGVGKNAAEAEADAAAMTDGNSDANRGSEPRVASLTEAGRVTIVVRLVAEENTTAVPTAIQLQVQTSSNVQLRRILVSVLSMPMALQDSAQGTATNSALMAEVTAQACAVHAEACRELVVSHRSDRDPEATTERVRNSVEREWRLMAAESGAYLGIGGKLWDSSWNMAAFLVEDYCTAMAMSTVDGGRSCGGLVAGRRVLELGAGTGVLGSLCAELGAASVTVTDLATSVPLIELNLLLNFAGPKSTLGAAADTQCDNGATTLPTVPVSKALPWGEPIKQDVIEQIGGLPCKLCGVSFLSCTGDWRHWLCDIFLMRPTAVQVIVYCYATSFMSPTCSLSFCAGVPCAQLILANLCNVLELKATMGELCGPETLILLAYRRRNPDEWQFFERLAADGFTVEPLLPSTATSANSGRQLSTEPWVPTFGSHLLRVRRVGAVPTPLLVPTAQSLGRRSALPAK